MVRYAATIFVSAFLLFQVQPMVARFILPWFGGSSLVWTTCMLFFQMVLVLGYAYAHWVTGRLTPKQQWFLHSVLLVVALLFLPVRPTEYWKPPNADVPTLRILALLAASVGLPFFLLSTTGPLIQAWQSKTHPDRSPFRLFALSNAASLAALVSYPFLFERYLTIQSQSVTWSVAFAVFAVLAFLSGRLFHNRSPVVPEPGRDPDRRPPGEPAGIGVLPFVLWLVLPMLASIQLLATTNLMTQEIGSLPFLWILPLSLYLLSFIICFDHQRWYVRPVFFALFFGGAMYSAVVLEAGVDAPIAVQVIGYSVICFGASMCCHGELARIKPATDHLTMFYLMVAIGGALGGVFVAVVAPRLFTGYYEFQLGLILAIVCCLVAYGMQVRTPGDGKSMSSGRLALFGCTLFAGLLTAFFVGSSFATVWIADNEKDVVAKTRSPYGTLTVKDLGYLRKLNNGRIEHGFQLEDARFEMEPTSYYGPDSGLGVAIKYLRREARIADRDGLDFGAIGLGVGTICGWCLREDRIRYFEINPDVPEIAHRYFTYLRNCASKPEIVMGDARLQLEREVKNGDPRRYDVLIADAFSSDSIPMHLLTLESMKIYKARLKPHGVLAVHTSNRFLHLENVVKVLADEIGMQAVMVEDFPDDDELYNSSTWVLVTNNEAFVDYLEERYVEDWPEEKYSARWTDDFASIIPVIRREEDSSWFREVLEEKGWTKK